MEKNGEPEARDAHYHDSDHSEAYGGASSFFAASPLLCPATLWWLVSVCHHLVAFEARSAISMREYLWSMYGTETPPGGRRPAMATVPGRPGHAHDSHLDSVRYLQLDKHSCRLYWRIFAGNRSGPDQLAMRCTEVANLLLRHVLVPCVLREAYGHAIVLSRQQRADPTGSG